MVFFLVAYALVLVGIGAYSWRRRSSSGEDFLLAGRSVGAWMSAFAYGTSYFSAVVFIGYAGQFGWNFGASASWIGIGNAVIGSLLAWWVLARPTRRMTQKMDARTMPEFLGKRYGAPALKYLSAVVVFFFLLPYSASVFQGISYLFETLVGIPFLYCMIGIIVFTAVYLLAGGYLGTVLSNFVQGLIMLVGMVLVVIFIMKSPQVGGLSAGLEKLNAVENGLGSFAGNGNFLSLLSVVILTSLGVWGLPQMTHKFYAIKDESSIKKGTLISMVFALIVGGGSYFIGCFARLFCADSAVLPVDAATGLGNMSLLVPQMLMAALPTALVGVVLILVLSASMSTLSSLVLVSASAVCMDLMPKKAQEKLGDQKMKRLMQICCMIFLLLSFALAVNKNNTITQLMNLSWGTLAGAFLGPYLVGLVMRRATRAGAWAGFAGGLVIAVLGNLLLTRFVPGLSSAMVGSAAMILSVIISVLVSLCTKPMDQKLLAQAFEKE